MVNGENDFAYPFVINGKHVCTGMTLRDYFAAKAMQALIANTKGPTHLGVGCDDENNSYANASFSIADAMMRARND